ncbi:MAG: ABC transporter permease [Elusimicrobia bacterium]|nr:ABC transporter permease [Elusimicrobiota bacterium]
MTAKALSITRYTVIQLFRNKLFSILGIFGCILLGASLLIASLGGDQQLRVLLDLGLACLEFLALVSGVFAAVTLILEEMEARTIALVLIRPLHRAEYLVGRFLGLLTALLLSMGIMAALHLGLLFFKGWRWDASYLVAVAFSAGKIMVITSLALFLSLFATSSISALTLTFFLWVLGHFSQELKFLANKTGYPAFTALVKAIYYVVPNFAYLNLKDHLEGTGVMGRWLGGAALYAVCYTVACLTLALGLFRRKEF